MKDFWILCIKDNQYNLHQVVANDAQDAIRRVSNLHDLEIADASDIYVWDKEPCLYERYGMMTVL